MKQSFTIILAILCSSCLFAQKTTFGIKAGINGSKWKFDESASGFSAKYKTGFEAGAFAAVKLSSHWTLQPELFFAGQGTALSMEGETLDYNTSYLMVPLLAKFRFPLTGLSVVAGPEVGFLLGASYTYNDEKKDLKQYLNSSAFFGVLGTEYHFPKGINVGARYTFSLSELQDKGQTQVARQRSFNVSVGYELSRVFRKIKK